MKTKNNINFKDIYISGAPALENLRNIKFKSRENLLKELKVKEIKNQKVIIGSFHPETTKSIEENKKNAQIISGARSSLFLPFKNLGLIIIDEEHRFGVRQKEAIKSLENLRLDMEKYPRSVAIFPEGSRSKDGNLQDFKKGAAIFGIDTGMPIIPVAIVGSYSWWNRGLFAKNSNIITIIFGDPIDTKNSSYEDRNKITMGIKDQITKLRNG